MNQINYIINKFNFIIYIYMDTIDKNKKNKYLIPDKYLYINFTDSYLSLMLSILGIVLIFMTIQKLTMIIIL